MFESIIYVIILSVGFLFLTYLRVKVLEKKMAAIKQEEQVSEEKTFDLESEEAVYQYAAEKYKNYLMILHSVWKKPNDQQHINIKSEYRRFILDLNSKRFNKMTYLDFVQVYFLLAMVKNDLITYKKKQNGDLYEKVDWCYNIVVSKLVQCKESVNESDSIAQSLPELLGKAHYQRVEGLSSLVLNIPSRPNEFIEISNFFSSEAELEIRVALLAKVGRVHLLEVSKNADPAQQRIAVVNAVLHQYTIITQEVAKEAAEEQRLLEKKKRREEKKQANVSGPKGESGIPGVEETTLIPESSPIVSGEEVGSALEKPKTPSKSHPVVVLSNARSGISRIGRSKNKNHKPDPSKFVSIVRRPAQQVVPASPKQLPVVVKITTFDSKENFPQANSIGGFLNSRHQFDFPTYHHDTSGASSEGGVPCRAQPNLVVSSQAMLYQQFFGGFVKKPSKPLLKIKAVDNFVPNSNSVSVREWPYLPTQIPKEIMPQVIERPALDESKQVNAEVETKPQSVGDTNSPLSENQHQVAETTHMDVAEAEVKQEVLDDKPAADQKDQSDPILTQLYYDVRQATNEGRSLIGLYHRVTKRERDIRSQEFKRTAMLEDPHPPMNNPVSVPIPVPMPYPVPVPVPMPYPVFVPAAMPIFRIYDTGGALQRTLFFDPRQPIPSAVDIVLSSTQPHY